MTNTSDHVFVAFLERLRESKERAKLAALRRALGKEPLAAPEAWPIVMPFVPERAGERIERVYFLVAALFALHPKSWPRPDEGDRRRRDFGASMRLLAERRPGGGVDRRFAALLAADDADLGEHLRHAVSLLKSDDVPIDWKHLISDLKEWNYERRDAQRRWARSFWAGTAPNEDNAHDAEQSKE